MELKALGGETGHGQDMLEDRKIKIKEAVLAEMSVERRHELEEKGMDMDVLIARIVEHLFIDPTENYNDEDFISRIAHREAQLIIWPEGEDSLKGLIRKVIAKYETV